MSNLAAHPADPARATVVTLWRCSKCSSFISVESINPFHVVMCPACQHASLVLRGSFKHVLDLRSEDDTCCDYYPNGW